MNSAELTDYRIALLIDADNSPADKVAVILSELSKLGMTNIRRAYGNWKKPQLKAWEERLHEFAIRPMQQFDYSKGKNASDMAQSKQAAPPQKLTPEQLQRDNRLIGSLRESVAAVEDETGWSRVGAVGSHMANKSSFDPRNYSYPTLTKLLAATGAFDLQHEGTSQGQVRIRRHSIPHSSRGRLASGADNKNVGVTRSVAQDEAAKTLSTAPDPAPPGESPTDEITRIFHTFPNWAVGEARSISTLGKALRTSGLKSNSEALHSVFGRHPDHFALTPTVSPRQVKRTR